MKNKNTTTLQMGILLFLLIQGIFAVVGYKFFLSLSIKNTILSIFLGSLFGVLFLHIYFYFLKKIDWKKITKIKVVKIVYLVFLSLITSYFLYLFSSYIHYIYLNKNNLLFIMITLFLLFLYTYHLKPFILSRTLEIILYIFLFFVFIKIIGLVPYVDVLSLIPITDGNIANILLSSILFGIITSVLVFLLLIFFNKEIDSKKIKYYLTSSYVSSCFLLLVSYVLIIGILGYKLGIFYPYPEVMILKNIAFFDFIERVDYILVFEYLLVIYSLISILLLNIKKTIHSFKNVFFDKHISLYLVFLFIISFIFNW